MPISCSRGSPVGADATRTRSAAKASASPMMPPVAPENGAFEQQPHGDVGTPRAKSRADRQFLTAPFNPHQQQIGDVGACNQQHHHNRTHQDPKHISYIADDILFESVEIGADLDLFKDARY